MPQLQSEELIERTTDLVPIAELLAEAVEGRGASALVAGPPGIGKTALLAAARELGRDRGFTVLGAVGTDLERGIPFGIARQLFGVAHQLLGEDRAAISSVLSTAEGKGRDMRGSFQALDDLYWYAQDLSQQSPLLMIVDDIQWCDEPSLQYLSYLNRRLEGMSIALVVSLRSAGAPALSLEQFIQATALRVDLDPLSLGGVETLIERVLGSAPTSEFAAACRKQTGGYPLYLHKMLEVVRERHLNPDDFATPEVEGISVEGLVWHVWSRIASLGTEAETTAGLIAVLGEHANRRRIAELGGLGNIEVAEAIDRLTDQGVLEQGDLPRFAHPVLRTAVEDRLSPRSLDRWHRTAAHLLESEGVDVRGISGHLMRCLPAGDQWIVECLRKYAAAVLGNGTPEPAVSALERALAEPPMKNERVSVLRELAEAEEAAGDCSGARHHLEEALRLATSARDRAEIWAALGSIFSMLNRYEDALEAFEAGSEQLGSSDPELKRKIDVERINFAFLAHGFNERDLRRLDECMKDIPAGPVGMGILTAQAAAAAMKFHEIDKAAALAERALRTGGLQNAGTNSEVFSLAVFVLTYAGRADLACQLTERELAQARRQGHLRDIFTLELGLAASALNCGDIPTAVSRVEGALAVTEPGPHVAWAHAIHVRSLVEAGDLEAAEHALGAADPEHWDEKVSGSYSIYFASALLHIAQRRFPEAATDVDEMRWRSEEYAPGLQGGDNVWRWIGAVVAHHQGDEGKAQMLAAQELTEARKTGSIGLLGRILRVAALVGHPESEIELLQESVDLFGSSCCRLEYARSLVELGSALRRRGERVAAREPLKEGVDIAYRCGGGAVVSQGLAELKATGARPRRLVLEGPDALTPREARMAQLAANGCSNRQIAQELYVSLATVEGTLWRAYAKLGISGHGARAALPEALGPLFSTA